MQRALTTLLVIAVLALTLTSAFAVRPIRVHVEARPSTDCFPVSSLQQGELQQDFQRVCEECEPVETTREAEFDVIVEDPGASWLLTIYDRRGSLVETLKWNGSLDRGLEKVTKIIREQTRN